MSNFSEFWPWVKDIKTPTHKRPTGTKASQTDGHFSNLQISNWLQIAYLNTQAFQRAVDSEGIQPPSLCFHTVHPAQPKPA